MRPRNVKSLAGPDYIALVVRAVSERLEAGSSSLAAFHAVVPALALNAVEAALLSKEQLPHRRHLTSAASFTDDGLPLGLAFLLKVLL